MLPPLLPQEEGEGAKPTVVVAELGDPKRDPGYWVRLAVPRSAGLLVTAPVQAPCLLALGADAAYHKPAPVLIPEACLASNGRVNFHKLCCRLCSAIPLLLPCPRCTSPSPKTEVLGMLRLLQGTARMVLEAGLCLALQQDQLDRSQQLRGGVLTPATAMGSFLIERLRKAGLTYEVQKVIRP